MANGISCAFFAGKNLIYGQKEQNVFKEGIGAIQTTRTLDSIAQSSAVKIPHATGLNKVANLAKKILYPLIVLSGIFNTIKSDDKVKTGVNQASSIATMFTFETIAEKFLINAEKKLLEMPTVKNNKKLAFGVYVLKGAAFVCASLLGYSVGDKISNKAVDKVREHKNLKKSDSEKELKKLNIEEIEMYMGEEPNIFEGMDIIKEA